MGRTKNIQYTRGLCYPIFYLAIEMFNIMANIMGKQNQNYYYFMNNEHLTVNTEHPTKWLYGKYVERIKVYISNTYSWVRFCTLIN